MEIQWNDIWGKRDSAHVEDIKAWTSILKAQAFAQEAITLRDRITPEMVMRATKLLKRDTSLGIDWWEVEWLRTMTYEVAVQIAKLLNSIEKEAARPAQTLTNIIVLMGKPAGGVRPVLLL